MMMHTPTHTHINAPMCIPHTPLWVPLHAPYMQSMCSPMHSPMCTPTHTSTCTAAI